MPLKAVVVVVALCACAGPALAQEREWSLEASDKDAFLTFGVPQTDDVGASFWCRKGSGQIQLFVPGPQGPRAKRSREMSITVDGQSFAAKARTQANQINGGISVEAKFKGSDPMFSALAKSDRFTVSINGANMTYPLAEADLEGLLEVCGAR
jgi:hypothetical protein